MRDWIRLSLAWDGILPMTTTAIPFAVWLVFRDHQFAAILTLFFVPMLAAMVRAPIGEMQIAAICDGRAPALRQIAMGLAITLLMLLDGITTLWILAPPEVSPGFLPAAGIYAGYLFFVALALAPSSATRQRWRGSLRQ